MVSDSKETPALGMWAVASLSLSIVTVWQCCQSFLSFLFLTVWTWPKMFLLAPVASIGLAIIAIVWREQWARIAFCVSSLSSGVYCVLLLVLSIISLLRWAE